MAYTWYTKGSGLDFDSHENYVDYTDNIHSQTGVAFNCGAAPYVSKNIDNLTDFYIGFTVYYAKDNPGPYGAWNWLKVIGNDTVFINGSDNYLCCMPDSNGYKPPYKKGLSHIIVHVDTVNDKIEYWYNLQKVYTRESAGIAGKSYTAINMCPTGGGTNYAQRDNAISDLIITTEKTELDKYTSKFFQPVSITFDGKTNYAEIPVSLTDTADWSAEIIFTTTENGSDNRVYHQPCLFGYDSVGAISRDFHVDTSGGNLYVFSGLGNSSAPVGGTVSWSTDWGAKDCGVNTGIKVNDGKKHTVKAISTTGKIEVYCDGVLATTIYPTTTLSANAFYIGCSKISESVFGQLTLYSFTLTKNGAVVAEYNPIAKDVALKTLTDKSGNGNDATLYGNVYEYKAVDILFNFSADTSRAVQTTTSVDADTCRTIAEHLADFDFSADTARTVHRAEIVGADTGRTIQSATTVNADAARKTVLLFQIDADTQRQFGMSFSVIADTSCTIERTEKINADFVRRIEKTIAVNVDATRDVQAPFSFAVDTTRNLQNNVNLSVDTSRTVERIESVNGDSIRYLVFDMDKLLIPANQPPAQGEFTPFPANPPKAAKQGIISMTLELATGTLSDTLNFETFGTDFTPKRAIRGTFLGFPYEYLVEQVTSIGKRQTVTCMNQIDQKKYAKVDTGDLLSSAEDVAKKIADSLGLKLETYHEKFTVTTTYTDRNVVPASMINELYGWVQNLPWRKINVFFRDKTMYVVQRGYEPREPYDITALHYPEPTITQAVYRNQYSKNNKHSKAGKNPKTKGFSGSVTYPNGGFTNYEDGKPTDSVKYQNGIETDTWWSYDGWGRMTHQIVDTKPSSDFAGNPPNKNANYTHSEIRVEYYGECPENGAYEVSETTTVTKETDRKTGKTTTTKTVNYSESAPGSTSSTTINSDGGVASATGSTLLQTNSDFARNQYNTVSCGGRPEWIVEGGDVFDENTITDFPINDTDGGLTLGEIAAELNAYDRCIQETLQIELVEPVVDGKPTITHIVDFLERVKFRGNEYYLERNEIERTTREIKQTITAVRWEGDLSEIEKGGGTP